MQMARRARRRTHTAPFAEGRRGPGPARPSRRPTWNSATQRSEASRAAERDVSPDATLAPARGSILLLLLEDLVDEPVLLGWPGPHVEVAIDVLRDLVPRLAGVIDEDLRDDVLHVTDLASLDLDVRRLPARAAERLMDHHARMRERIALALLSGAEQDSRHARRLPEAQRAHRTAHVLHGVVEGGARRHDPARRVDVELDVLVRILALQKQELGDDDVGDVVVDGAAEEHDAVLQQAAEDVPRTLAAMGRLDDVRID